MEQEELRLLLLIIGAVVIGIIYIWGTRKNIQAALERRRRLKKQRNAETLMDAMPKFGAENQPKAKEPAKPHMGDGFEVRVIDRTAEYEQQEPGAQEPGAQEPGAQEPGAQKPGAQKPGAQKPGAQKPGAQKPAASPSGGQSPEPGKPQPPESVVNDTKTEPDQIVTSTAAEPEPTPEPESESEIPSESEPESEPAPAGASMTVLLTVLAARGQAFSGIDIRHVSRELALPIGEQGLLECNTDTEPGEEPKTVFSVAHLREPGTFNEETLNSLSTPGLLLFLKLPGPLAATEAVRLMFGVAGQLAEKLGGTVCDERRQRITRDGYVELHHKASQFEQELELREA